MKVAELQDVARSQGGIEHGASARHSHRASEFFHTLPPLEHLKLCSLINVIGDLVHVPADGIPTALLELRFACV